MDRDIRIDYTKLTDLDPAERFAAAGQVQDQARASQSRYRAMVVMELWEAAHPIGRAATVADTLGVSVQRVHQIKAVGQEWLWEAVLNPATGVRLDAQRRQDLADVLADEGEKWASVVRRIRSARGPEVAFTLRELNAIMPVVEAIPEFWAHRDRLVPTLRSAWWDAAAEQHHRFRADRTDMEYLSRTPQEWADLYGYPRACTVLEQALAAAKDGHPRRPYLGGGAEVATKERFRDLDRAAAQLRRGSGDDGWVMPRDDQEQLRHRPGTWRWGLTHA